MAKDKTEPVDAEKKDAGGSEDKPTDPQAKGETAPEPPGTATSQAVVPALAAQVVEDEEAVADDGDRIPGAGRTGIAVTTGKRIPLKYSPRQQGGRTTGKSKGDAVYSSQLSVVKIEDSITQWQHLATFSLLLGLMFAILETESCFVRCKEVACDNLPILDLLPDSCQTSKTMIFKVLTLLSSALGVTAIYRRAAMEQVLEMFENHLMYFARLGPPRIQGVRLFVYNLPEILLLGICVPPGLDDVIVKLPMLGVTANYRLESLGTGYMFVRFLSVIYSLQLWLLTDPKKRFAARLHGVRFGFLTIYKHAMSTHATRVTAWSFVVFTTASAYLVRLFEAPIQDALSENFWTAIWFSVVTQSSTGFGEMVPKTHMGRFAAVLNMLVGLIFVAVVTALVTRWQTLSPAEHKTKQQLESLLWQSKREDLAARLIQAYFERYFSNRYRRRAKQSSFENAIQNCFPRMFAHTHSTARRYEIAEANHRKIRTAYIAWKRTDPHFGESVDKLNVVHANLNEGVNKLQDYFLSRDVPFADWLAAFQKFKSSQKEVKDTTGHEVTNETDVLLFMEFADQKRRIEQLLRAVVYLSSAHQADTTVLKASIQSLSIHVKSDKA